MFGVVGLDRFMVVLRKAPRDESAGAEYGTEWVNACASPVAAVGSVGGVDEEVAGDGGQDGDGSGSSLTA